MTSNVIEALHIKTNSNYIDGTLGNGGHSLEILKNGGKVLGIDLDPSMVEIAQTRLNLEKMDENNYLLVNGNFADIDKIAKIHKWQNIAGILVDLGVTNLHLKNPDRGFSFINPDAALDMRIDPNSQGVKASDLLNMLRPDQLEDLFVTVVDLSSARWLTKRICEFRKNKLITITKDFLKICQGLRSEKQLNIATLPLLALRIAVNSELTNLENFLPKAFELLEPNGRLVIISFHSGEDAIVKKFFKLKAFEGVAKISEGPIMASKAEVELNNKSRSAKMRILEKRYD